MKINFSQALKNGGESLKGPEGEEIKLYIPCVNALWAIYEDEKLNGKEKYKRGDLAERIDKQEEVEVTVEEISLMKDVVGKAYNPMMIKKVWDLLEKSD